MMEVSYSAHTMKPEPRMEGECLHWVDQHTGEETNTYDWLNSFCTCFFDLVLDRAGTRDLEVAVRWVDREVTKERVGVETFLDRLCEN